MKPWKRGDRHHCGFYAGSHIADLDCVKYAVTHGDGKRDPRCTGPFHEGHAAGECPYGYNGPENICPVHLDIPCPNGCPYFARPRAEPDPISNPSHYTSHPSGIQPITITRHETFCLGNVIKYCMRAKHKGNEVGDLRKAAQYLQWEIERLEGQS